MYARVTVVQGSADKVDTGIDSFKSQVLPAVKSVDGYKGALLLVDRSSGKGIGLTLWETEAARNEGAKAVAAAREATIQEMGGAVSPAEEFEVAVLDM